MKLMEVFGKVSAMNVAVVEQQEARKTEILPAMLADTVQRKRPILHETS